MYLKNLRKFFIATVASMLAFTLINANTSKTVKAAETITYPFATGEEALQYAPTVTAPATNSSGDSWMFYQHNFDSNVNLSSVTYIAVEFKLVKGTPGLTFGVLSNGNRFGTYGSNGRVFYFVSEDGTVSEYTTLWDSINLAANSSGMLLMKTFGSWGGNAADATLGTCSSFFVESNNRYNCNFSFKIGEVGYYTGDPFTGAPMTKILELSTVKKNYYSAVFDVSFPEVNENNIAGQKAVYPFGKENEAYKNGMIWTSPTSAGLTYQTLKVKFDEVTDLTNATYIAVEYYSKKGMPGITYGFESNGNRHSIVGSSGNDVYVMAQNGAISKASNILYDAVTTSASGCLLIPMDYINYQFGANSQTITSVTHLTLATNVFYNYNFEIVVGEVGYYTGRIQTGDFTFHKVLDLSNGAKDNSFAIAYDNSSDSKSTLTRYVNANFLNGVNTYMNLAYRYTVTTEGEEKTYSDVEFRIQAGVHTSIVDIAASYSCTEWGIEVNGVKFNAVTKIDEEKAIKYVVISLGDVLNNIEERATVDFSVKAYAVINGSTYYSNVVKTYSVADMIAEYNSKGKPVAGVYNIFESAGLYA